jgi:hypothetical protein
MTTPRPDLVNLPQLTTPSEANTLIVVQDSAVAQYLTVPQARALLSLTVGYSGSRGQVGFVGSTGYTGSFGLTGYTGSTGTQGVIGYTGSTGTAATVAVGLVTVSTSTASVTNVGTPYAAIFDFVLQRGPIGYTGSQGGIGLTGYTGSTGTQGDIGFTGSRGLSLTTATDLAGGAVGSIPIQVATSQTGFIPIGSNGQLLQVSGATAVWASTSTLHVGRAATSDLEYITQLTTATTPTTRYPTMVIGAGGYASLGSTLDFSYNAATKNLTAGGMTLTNTTSATSTITGALNVAGGVGIGGNLYIGGSLYVDFVGTATNLKGGTAGQVPFQTATGVTSFFGPGTAGNVLVSNGTSAPSYNNTLTLAGTTTATSTQTGALVVAGGVGIGGNLYVGGEIIADKLTIQLTTVTTTLVTTDDIIRTYNTTSAVSTTTGALQIAGGAGIGGDLYVGGNIYPLGIIGTISTASNIAGGTIGGVLFQRAIGSTTATTSGNDGEIFVSRGATALGPRFVNTGSIFVGYANTALNVIGAVSTATNLAGGTAQSIVYQSAPGLTAYLAASSTSGWILSSNGVSSPPTWVPGAGSANFAGTATNLEGGTAGQVPYQLSTSTTRFFGPGTAGNVLVSNGTSAPSYNNTLTLTSLTSATSTQTGALQVSGGVGIGGTVYLGGYLQVGTTSTTTGTNGEIRATNEITAYFGSDIRLKENIQLIDNPITLINQIRGVRFDWTEDYIQGRGGLDGYFVRKHDIGVIAQEIESILPEIVATRDDGFKAVKYEKIVPLLIESIKELHREIEILKKKIQ